MSKILEYTPENPEGVQRDFTPEEEAQLIKDDENVAADFAAIKLADDKKIADKASGNQKLKDLGLTDDEIAALTGAEHTIVAGTQTL